MSSMISSAPARPEQIAPKIDLDALRAYRLSRVQAQLRADGLDAILLINPVNIRYATDARNMTVWTLHNMGRYCLVPASGKAVLFEFPSGNCRNMNRDLPAIAEVRQATVHSWFDAGEHAEKVAAIWAAEIADLVRRWAGNRRPRLAVDKGDLHGLRALEAQGLELAEGQRVTELARAIKSVDELACMRRSLAVCEYGIERMREALRPGATEQEVWAELHHANIVHGGEWIETRLLASGPRTNPWFQECSDRVIAAGDIVSFDTDMVGPYGYCADLSRTFVCGGKPTREQRDIYTVALEQVRHNTELLRPGLSFRDYARSAWRIPQRFFDQNYGAVAHGIGLVDEWPLILINPDDPWFEEGVFEPGMTICVESYIGEVGGAFGVKLEEQVLITETGHEVLSPRPLEALE